MVESFVYKVDSHLNFSAGIRQELLVRHLPYWCAVFRVICSRWFATLASLSCCLLQRIGNIIAVNLYMDLILVLGVAVQYNSKLVSPLYASCDPRWLAHCLHHCHAIYDCHLYE